MYAETPLIRAFAGRSGRGSDPTCVANIEYVSKLLIQDGDFSQGIKNAGSRPAFLLHISDLLASAFHGGGQLNVFGCRAQIHLDAKIFHFDGGGACEAGTVAAPRVFAFTNELRRDHHWLGHAVEGQVAGDVGSAFTGGLDAGGLEGRGRVLAYI